MVDSTADDFRKALATVSTLKRVMGIPNHSSKKDSYDGKEKRLHIYTSDEESATLLAELLYRYGTGNQAALYKAHPEWHTIRDTIHVEPFESTGYHIEMLVPSPTGFKTAVDKMIKKHCSPDSRFTRY